MCPFSTVGDGIRVQADTEKGGGGEPGGDWGSLLPSVPHMPRMCFSNRQVVIVNSVSRTTKMLRWAVIGFAKIKPR